MGKSLVTKLNGVINNTDLRKIGEMRFYFKKENDSPNVYNHTINLTFTDNCEIHVTGGNFVNESFDKNIGNILKATKNVPLNIFLSNDDCFISVNKYLLSRINVVDNVIKQSLYFDIEELKYSSNLKSIRTYTGSSVSGDISALKDLTALTYIDLASSSVSGDISALKDLTALTHINLTGSSVIGDISALSNMVNLKESRLVSQNKIYGDLSNLPENIRFLTVKPKTLMNWKGMRPAVSSIIGLESMNLDNDLDAMLTNMATCTDKKVSGQPAWYNRISVYGTRTSASDDAVQSLQQKGYTVSVTPA